MVRKPHVCTTAYNTMLALLIKLVSNKTGCKSVNSNIFLLRMQSSLINNVMIGALGNIQGHNFYVGMLSDMKLER